MSVILEKPNSVLLVGFETDLEGRFREICSDLADDIVACDDAATGLELCGSEIACLVVDGDLPQLGQFRGNVAATDDRLPVVVITGEDPADRCFEVTQWSPTTVLRRPVDDELLHETVSNCLETYRQQRIADEEVDMFRSLLSELNVPIFVKDEQGRHLRMTQVPGGVDQETVLGKTDLEVYGYDSEAASEFYEDDMRVIEEGEAIRQKDEASGPERNEHWARVSKVPWPAPDGSIKGLLGISVEITGLKQAEQRAEMLEDRIEQFANHVRHDVQNPLQVASGHAQIAKQTGEVQHLETVLDALDRINEIVTDLDYMARKPPSGEGTDFVDIPFVAEQVWLFIGKDTAELELELPEAARIHATLEGLRPLLENLLRNAVVHGGDDVTVRIGTLEDGFYVADDGPGIPPSDRERVFKRGYTTADDGDGAGLAIVSEIAERNGWSLSVTGSAAGGARFEIRDALIVPEPDVRMQRGEQIELGETGFTPARTGTEKPEANRSGGVWSLANSGGNDHPEPTFTYAFTEVTGPVRIEAHVSELTHINDYSRAGLMIRDGSRLGSPFGFIGRTVGRGNELITRTERGAEPTQTLLDEEPVYERFRIDRVGETCTFSVSTNGSNWEPLEQQSLGLEDPVRIGIAVASAVPGEPCEATIRNAVVFQLEQA